MIKSIGFLDWHSIYILLQNNYIICDDDNDEYRDWGFQTFWKVYFRVRWKYSKVLIAVKAIYVIV